ncbi:hypothetical protein niasHT_006803 [Heterodera trifolii]|uniref:Uncharacterized protein n=1 Tax=Heterodera trifolii TaxID=157864 RepID=A0ABD2M6V1_9BILA
MQKYPLGNTKNVAGSSGHSKAKCSETTKWFQRKLGPFIQIEEQKKNNYESKQKKKSRWEEKKRLKKIMQVRQMAAYNRRCQLWDPEKEQFKEEGEKEQEENGKEEEEGGGGERNEREKEAAEEELDDSEEEEENDDDNEELENEGVVTEEEEMSEEEEEELEDEEEWEEMMGKESDFESGDDGIELVRRKVPANEKEQKAKDGTATKRKRVDLFDDEASLSGDDVGSDSDGETQDDEPDEYEAEEGDLDQLPDTEEIRENLMCQYQKHQNDDSDRKIRRLKEAFLPDKELHGQGDSGNRSFRFRRHANANVDWAKLLGTTNDENEEEDKDDPAEEACRRKRFEMNKWRAEQEEQKRRAKKRTRGEGTSGGRWDTDDEEEMWADLDSPLFALGRKNLRASKDANSDSPVPSSSHLSSSSLFADVTIPPRPKHRDSLLHSSLRRKDAATERTVPSPFVKDVRLPKHRHNV